MVFEVNWSSAKISSSKFHWKILWLASVRKQYIVTCMLRSRFDVCKDDALLAVATEVVSIIGLCYQTDGAYQLESHQQMPP